MSTLYNEWEGGLQTRVDMWAAIGKRLYAYIDADTYNKMEDDLKRNVEEEKNRFNLWLLEYNDLLLADKITHVDMRRAWEERQIKEKLLFNLWLDEWEKQLYANLEAKLNEQ